MWKKKKKRQTDRETDRQSQIDTQRHRGSVPALTDGIAGERTPRRCGRLLHGGVQRPDVGAVGKLGLQLVRELLVVVHTHQPCTPHATQPLGLFLYCYTLRPAGFHN